MVGANERPLNVTDALSYLDAVKNRFSERPDVYNRFLDIMKDFKSQHIDTPGVIERVSTLFAGHPQLIQGFNTFLPAGYRIECTVSQDPLDPAHTSLITVTTPTGTVTTSSAPSAPPFARAPPATAKDKEKPMTTPGQVLQSSVEVASEVHARERERERDRERGPEASGSDKIPVPMAVDDPEHFPPALLFVQKLRTRTDPETYAKFLRIMSQGAGLSQEEQSAILAQMEKLVEKDADLYASFQAIMSESYMLQHGQHQPAHTLQHDRRFVSPPPRAPARKDKERTREADRERERENAPVVPVKRKRKVPEKEKERERERDVRSESGRDRSVVKKSRGHERDREVASSARERDRASASDRDRSHHYSQQHQQPAHGRSNGPHGPAGHPVQEDGHFFALVKRALDSRETYAEFLKLVNLFTQGFIDRGRLVAESRSFLGDGELMARWKEILGWDEKKEVFGGIAGMGAINGIEKREREGRQTAGADRERTVGLAMRADMHAKEGSYRRLPESERHVLCSGRDDMCKSVLNDEWVSHPSWASEDAGSGGFATHKKNIYEEALHRSEEERHEYDFHIEAIVRTIAMLEPLNHKILQLAPDELAAFKLKPNLNGMGKAVHQRVIKKIYGREAGVEVVRAMQETPALAVPVVLTRLKQKEEEWKRAQREWNKVWREADARNYWRALDYRGVSFRQADKRAMAARTLVSQIEAAREEQMARRAQYIDPLFARTRPRHQLELEVAEMPVLQDAMKLIFSFLDRTAGQIPAADRRRVEGFLRIFVPLFFMQDATTFNAAFAAAITVSSQDADASDDVASAGATEDAEVTTAASSSTRAARSSRKSAGASTGDLRKRLLKSEQAKSSRKTRGHGQETATPSPSGSRRASPARSDAMDVDQQDTHLRHTDDIAAVKTPRKGSFFTNTNFYVLMRQLEMLYSRLAFFKEAAARLAEKPVVAARQKEALAKDLGATAANESAAVPALQAQAAQYYDVMLDACERLFDNEIEMSAFEDQMRFMFGPKDAYSMFTIDRLIGTIVKQTQTTIADPRTPELFELLKRERQISKPTTQDAINYRKNAERVVGPDENLFRIEWLPDVKAMRIQLLGKDDVNVDDPEVMSGRWEAYIRSFTSPGTTAGVPENKIRRPFLQRSLGHARGREHPVAKMDVLGSDKLEIRICVKTYRFFYVPGTEDVFWRRTAPAQEIEACEKKVRQKDEVRNRWIEGFEKRNLNTPLNTPPAKEEDKQINAAQEVIVLS
ncbi:hypothetical protein PUNSTDRAFT_102594 [Punctularia strigosozonata HHB-11173 SS5]|uniref:uncharacterized protein n=1 Tax=Punctularia strigosozonata (strain HHB-11173) TaxID=741275 RepID=UPI0004417F87|nr:uncharacterized protein PUNSTDRAFT_102594 [Punctularia strigosozonata HHB-11173 SS5]EIN09044.1 hypothetical protein PUNSTDRAFT_102594 [Punctularia strigosozonata HHB-11173 SS5]